MQNSALGNLGKRMLAWIILAAVAVLVLKAIFGFITMIITFALIALAIVGVLWAVRHL